MSHLMLSIKICPTPVKPNVKYVFFERYDKSETYFHRLRSLRDTFSFPFLSPNLLKPAYPNPSLMHIKIHYICWAFSSSTDSSRSFIWLLSSSSWELGSSGSNRTLLLWETLFELGAAAGLGLVSALAVAGFWRDVDGVTVFVEGCEDKKEGEKYKTELWQSFSGCGSVLEGSKHILLFGLQIWSLKTIACIFI